MADPQWDFQKIYALFDPQNLDVGKKGTTSTHPINAVMKAIMGTTTFGTFEKIKDSLKSFNVKNGDKYIYRQDPDLRHFHGIGLNGSLFEEDPYFKNKGGSKNNSIANSKELCAGFNDTQNPIKKDKKLAVFVTHNPFITPARRNTTDIEFFLNSIPSIFASQMVPYLDIEMQIARQPVDSPTIAGKAQPHGASTHITSPTLMKFLLGAEEVSKLKGANAMMENGRLLQTTVSASVGGDGLPTNISFSGMEMFLAPQVFTNMDGLKQDSNTRLVDAKPFLPLASIEGFDVTSVNAGAGAMAHRKASLRLKIHDRSRLSEFAVFIRGSVGFATARIVTTYGWIAPRWRSNEDAYSRFINEKMMAKDTWMISNSSFTFDAMGQVSLVLEMVSAGQRQLQTAVIMDQGMTKYMDDLEKMAKVLTDMSEKFKTKFNIPDLKVLQVIDAGAGGKFPDMKESKKAIDELVKLLENPKINNQFSEEEIKSYKAAVNNLTSTDPKGLKALINAAADKSAEELMNKIMAQPDPFFPGVNRESDDPEYRQETYNDDYIQTLNKLNKWGITDIEAVKAAQAAQAARIARDAAAQAAFDKSPERQAALATAQRLLNPEFKQAQDELSQDFLKNLEANQTPEQRAQHIADAEDIRRRSLTFEQQRDEALATSNEFYAKAAAESRANQAARTRSEAVYHGDRQVYLFEEGYQHELRANQLNKMINDIADEASAKRAATHFANTAGPPQEPVWAALTGVGKVGL